ncbi:unnamed protein product [Periconia digitata]|uniref:Uncharacterized protein n=1 Tax=Periconia digitata TaxID=1303443 RepID=A0A9W4XCV4_9PLEO|nr:unnamed protein product [Periconia digitata]
MGGITVTIYPFHVSFLPANFYVTPCLCIVLVPRRPPILGLLRPGTTFIAFLGCPVSAVFLHCNLFCSCRCFCRVLSS